VPLTSLTAAHNDLCFPLLHAFTYMFTDSDGAENGSTTANNLAAAKAASANVAAAEQSANSSDNKKAAQSEEAKSTELGKKAAAESAKHFSKTLNAKLHENETKNYHLIDASHTKEKQAELQFKEKYAEAAKAAYKHVAKQAQQAAAKATQAAKEEQAAKKSYEAGKYCIIAFVLCSSIIVIHFECLHS
jgi:hypothetical protein